MRSLESPIRSPISRSVWLGSLTGYLIVALVILMLVVGALSLFVS